MAEKQRVHTEWVQPVQRNVCPSCSASKAERSPRFVRGLVIFAWGQYLNAKWHTVKYFCTECVREEFFKLLAEHAKPCGCSFRLQARSGYAFPEALLDRWREFWDIVNAGFPPTVTHFDITGEEMQGRKRFKLRTRNFIHAMGINLWRGTVWAVHEDGHRQMLKRVVN